LCVWVQYLPLWMCLSLALGRLLQRLVEFVVVGAEVAGLL